MGVSLYFSFTKFLIGFMTMKKRKAFIRACKNPAQVQRALKERLLKSSNHPFPEKPVDYLYYQNKKDLTSEQVLYWENTSGSTGKKKSIPYTKSLLKSFENMFLLWVHDLTTHSKLELETGKFFMSVSPKIGDADTDDRKYLSKLLSLLLKPYLASDPDDHKASTGDEFLFKVSRDLLKCRGLEVISIWSPTYLLGLLEFMKTHPVELDLEVHDWENVWPKLRLISCWTHGQARRSAEELQRLFPNVTIQPKGLLLTEAPVTIPWTEADGNVPLVTETYLEFLDQDGSLKGIEELSPGRVYTVITSQGNGFLRYNTQDRVIVTGFFHRTPMLEFIGREGLSSDLAGEKLSENLLQEAYQTLGQTLLLVPEYNSGLPGYTLFVEKNDQDFEAPLLQIFHYKLARDLRQLRPLSVREVKNLRQLYLKYFQNQGMVLGDIKERILFSNPTEAQRFQEWIDKEVQSSH